MIYTDNNSCSGLGATEFAWLKDCMEPIRERFESGRAKDELRELKRENQRLKQMVARFSPSDRYATSFFSH
ncbi:hypothetical protein ACFLUU_03050 [Chloroflexota bacterium]